MKIEGSTSYPSCGKFDWHGEQQRNVALGLGFRQGFGGETTRRGLVACLVVDYLIICFSSCSSCQDGRIYHARHGCYIRHGSGAACEACSCSNSAMNKESKEKQHKIV